MKCKLNPQVIQVGRVEFPLWLIVAVIIGIAFLGLIITLGGSDRLVV